MTDSKIKKLKRFSALPPIPEGRAYLVIAWLCWGKGAAIENALANCRKASYGEFKPGRSKCCVYHAHPDTYVSEDGSICYPSEPADAGPVKIGEFL